MEIRTHELTPDHLKEYQEIAAVAGLADEPIGETVWNGGRLTSSVRPDSPAPRKTLYVRLPSLTPAAVDSLRTTIRELEAVPPV
jgi:hypothetical protein